MSQKKRYESQLEAYKRYNNSEKGKLTREEWLKTEEGKRSIRESNAKYTETKRKDWLQTEKGQEYVERDTSAETRARRINDNKKVAQFIKEVRSKSGMTLEQFGEVLGLSFMAVSYYEQGVNRPPFDIIQRMAFKFGFKAKNLVTLVREAEQKSKDRVEK